MFKFPCLLTAVIATVWAISAASPVIGVIALMFWGLGLFFFQSDF